MSDPRALAEWPLLRHLPVDVRARVSQQAAETRFPFGAVMAAEGASADAVFVIVSGRARVIQRGETGDEIPLAMLGGGDSLGESPLLDGGTHPFTVRASSEVLALRIDATLLRPAIDANPGVRAHLALQRTYAQLLPVFRHLPSFTRLSPASLEALARVELSLVSFQPGQFVYREGDAAGPMYLVTDGRLRALQINGGRTSHLATLAAGDSFGAAAALRGTRRTATVEALTPVRLRTVSGRALDALAADLPSVRALLDEWLAQHDCRQLAARTSAMPLADDVVHDATDDAADIGNDPGDDPGVGATGDDAGDDAALTPDGLDAPFAEHGRFIKSRHRLRRLRFIRQIDEMDCGAACLAMVTHTLGRRASLVRIRQLVGAGLDGASLNSICSAGEELGLATRSVKTSTRHLDRLPLPAIVHWNEHHWVVLTAVRRGHVTVLDPALGRRRLTRAAFERGWSGYAALFDYTPAVDAAAPPAGRSLAWMWPLVRPHAGTLLQAVGLALVVNVLYMVLPVFTQVIVDRVLANEDRSLLNLLIAAMGLTMAFMVASLLVQRYLVSFAAVRIDAAALDLLAQRLLALPLSYFSARRTGDLQRRLEGIREVRDVLLQHGVSGLTAVGQLAMTLALMTAYNRPLTLVFVATAPLYALLMAVTARTLHPAFVDLEDAYSRYHSHQVDAIKGIETVKALAGESAFRRLLLNQFLTVSHRVFRADFTTLGYEGAIDAVTFLGLGLFLWAGAHQVLQGAMTIGGLVAFNSLVALSTTPIRNLLMLWTHLQRCEVILNRLDDVFQQEPEQGHDRSALRPVRELTGHVALRDVSVRIGGSDAVTILDGISLDVAAGSVVAIVGRSGSGKTTLARCLAGLLEPTTGTILYDGLDLRTLNYRHLRRRIGFVLQDCYVFSDTIARNIAFGDDEPDMARVAWAAAVANADEFIGRLPFGYDTRVGESGLGLSGGQRQRIAIARAVYRRPPVLILDEATSSLDAEAERAVQHNVDASLAGRTTFVVAHRVSTVQRADLIVVLERGRLVEQGSHDALLQRRGLYYHLVSQQLQVGV